MSKRITDRDKDIVKHVEKYGFITIRQVTNIWMSDSTYGYDIARKRLTALVEEGYLKYQKHRTLEAIYYIERKYSKPTQHTIKIMDIYANIIGIGAEVVYFKREQKWLDGEYRTDCFIIYKFDKYLYSMCCEVLDTVIYYSSKSKITEKLTDKYTNIFDSKEPYKLVQDNFKTQIGNHKTSVLIVDLNNNDYDWELGNNILTYSTDYNLSRICKVLLF